MTEQFTTRTRLASTQEADTITQWQEELNAIRGFDPVVVGRRAFDVSPDDNESDDKALNGDDIAIITVHDGPALDPGEIIAPAVLSDEGPNSHNNYQDIEHFLAAGGRRGRQLIPLTDGTYFLNRWFASVELVPKTVVPIGFVGVVVSYFGSEGHDLSGDTFRYGTQVAEGSRGVQTKTLGPGKYAFNTYAGHVHLVPTTNFVLHWITGRTESHRYDESLKSIELVTADAYEPVLPLSVVVHIDYRKASMVIQRFANIKKLITQTLDPMLSAYFRDIAHKKTMLELLHDRDIIQQEAKAELQRRFGEFDIELVDVLIGKPDTDESSGEIETLLQQLRMRQLSREQIQTYQQQCVAAAELRSLKLAEAEADKQTELTNSKVQIEIAENRGQAELVKARKMAEQNVVEAEAENKRRLLLAEADGKSRVITGEGESQRVTLEGEAEADVLRQKVEALGDPKLYALARIAGDLSKSKQPLVPERLFVSGGSEDGSATKSNMLGALVDMLVAERTSWSDEENSMPTGGPTSK